MTAYCKQVLADFDECTAQLRKNLEEQLSMENPQGEIDGGGMSHAAKVELGTIRFIVSFAWGDAARTFGSGSISN